ncbi:uncharacterized protein N7482_002205 [Penicillium canariense]|uniref:YCII-related domain-containing protein n=1 Tax=Penicillium canariense TaxID=189055 RepID=A0A9W9LTP0_9EURO|nr:uncharacterized protein N7482_002205 [Penicillium canariense]KAJ5176328.1 hypothetical protein N7482_002205 [Penicillium canariense]
MSSAPAKKEYLCILPDKPGAQAKRLEVRPSHLEGVKPLVAAGSIVVGDPEAAYLPMTDNVFVANTDTRLRTGAMLESHPAEGETPAFKGSMMLAVAESEAEVREILEKDIYTTSGVWDLANAQIIPFKSAVRKEL